MKIDKSRYTPILVVPAIPADDKICFYCPKKQLEISETPNKDLWEILKNCNGRKTIAAISEDLSINADYAEKIIAELDAIGVVSDSCKMYHHFHNLGNNPQVYPSKITLAELNEHKSNYKPHIKDGEFITIESNEDSALYPMQLNRKSCRSFSADKKLSRSQVGNICNYAYSLKRHAAPSGGALFPIRLFCVIPEDQLDIKAGYYEYDALNEQLIFYNENPDTEQLKYCYNDDMVAFDSPLQIIICADLDRQGFKYGNLAYRLTLIEVGQVAQNISLYCAEQGLGTCELGGILNNDLAVELAVEDQGISPVLAVAIGYESDESPAYMYSLYTYMLENYVGPDKVVTECGVHSFEQQSSFFCGWARFGEDGKLWAGATGTSYYSAVSKAMVEAYERHRSACVRVDFTGTADDSGAFVLPDDIAPLSQEQREKLSLIKYDKNTSIEWTKDDSGRFFLPSDFVYYGHNKKDKLFKSTSSGIAAHVDYRLAKEKALLELIERDAVMRMWFSQKSPRHFNPELYSQHIRNRIAYWKSQGRDVHILSLDSPYLPVYLVVITSDAYPCFVSGSAASLTSPVDAVHKALQETEYSLMINQVFPSVSCPAPDSVRHPVDHGRFYHFKENADKIQWIWSSNIYDNGEGFSPVTFDSLCDLLDVMFVDLSDDAEKRLKVVRAVSTKLIPITFGYGAEYYLHPELKKLNVNPKKDLPHFYA